MVELLRMAFFQKALVAGLLIGIAASLVGAFVVLRRLSSIGSGISHSAFGGVAIGLVMGINPYGSALIFAITVGLMIGLSVRRLSLSEDSAVGLFFPATMALGIAVLSKIEGYTPNLLSYLFGNILLVESRDILFAGGTLLLILLLLGLFYREWTALTFDAETAEATGIPVARMDALFLSLLAFVVVVSIKVVGIVLVSALLVTPPLTALKLSKSFSSLLLFSALAGALSTLAGIFLSYYINIPSGAAIVLFSTLLFFAVSLIKRRE